MTDVTFKTYETPENTHFNFVISYMVGSEKVVKTACFESEKWRECISRYNEYIKQVRLEVVSSQIRISEGLHRLLLDYILELIESTTQGSKELIENGLFDFVWSELEEREYKF